MLKYFVFLILVSHSFMQSAEKNEGKISYAEGIYLGTFINILKSINNDLKIETITADLKEFLDSGHIGKIEIVRNFANQNETYTGQFKYFFSNSNSVNPMIEKPKSEDAKMYYQQLIAEFNKQKKS